jgi:nucleotide-binding universal stress UspA family protein
MPAAPDLLPLSNSTSNKEASAYRTIFSSPAAATDGLADLLVAYDFSPAAATALEYAFELARHFGSTIHLINIETPEEHARIMSADPRAREHLRQNIERAFSRIEQRLRAKGIPCNSMFRVGDVASVLEGITLECKTDLLILGAFGHGSLDRADLGSTATHILRVARHPVLIIGPHAVRHPALSPAMERFICVTNSKGMNHEFLELCHKLAGGVRATIEFLCVVDPQHLAMVRQGHERQCEILSRALRSKGIRSSWSLLYGPPEQVIAAHANEANASLVVLETNPDGSSPSLQAAVVETIRRAHCPVLTVPSVERGAQCDRHHSMQR